MGARKSRSVDESTRTAGEKPKPARQSNEFEKTIQHAGMHLIELSRETRERTDSKRMKRSTRTGKKKDRFLSVVVNMSLRPTVLLYIGGFAHFFKKQDWQTSCFHSSSRSSVSENAKSSACSSLFPPCSFQAGSWEIPWMRWICPRLLCRGWVPA
jgi:hypothetical protein